MAKLHRKKRKNQIVILHLISNDSVKPSHLNRVVVVAVYLTTNQRHVGYLSSGNGHLAGRYSAP